MNWIKKLFCPHKWQTHDKLVRKWVEKKVVPDTASWFEPVLEECEYNEVTTVLTCPDCGAIKIIKY